MKDNKNIRQLFKYVTLLLSLMSVLYFYQIPCEQSVCITIILGTIHLFFDYYAPTYVVNLIEKVD
jgi:hypothetical protein